MAKKINITDKLNFKIRCGDNAPADGSIRREF